jgi:kynurenine formamidase
MKIYLYRDIFFYLFLIASTVVSCQDTPVQNESVPDLASGKWIDLSHPFDSNTIYWPTDNQGFRMDTVAYGITDQDYFYSAFSFCSAEHGGTHLDAPVHFAEGQKSVDGLGLDQLIGKAVVIDVSEKALADRDYLVTTEDFLAWESSNGQLPEGYIVVLYTGYGRFWPDWEDYLGTAELGPEAIPNLHFPGLSPEAATWLTSQRNIKAIGLDTPSIDYGQSTAFEAHRILFAHNIPAFENLTNLDQLPSRGIWVIALPMKIGGGSGAPLRAVAWIP